MKKPTYVVRCTLCSRITTVEHVERPHCQDCVRYSAIGTLVEHLNDFANGVHADALDAIADLLGQTTRLRRAHNRELRDEQLGAQRDARAAFDEGRAEGIRSGAEW